MAKVFHFWDVDQVWLLPRLLDEFVPPRHMAHFILDTMWYALGVRSRDEV
jgi:hypothetical protein